MSEPRTPSARPQWFLDLATKCDQTIVKLSMRRDNLSIDTALAVLGEARDALRWTARHVADDATPQPTPKEDRDHDCG